MKMGKAKGSRRQSKQVRKENLPYYGNRKSTSPPSSSSHHPSSDNLMADNSDDDCRITGVSNEPPSSSQHAASSWYLSANNITICHDLGITPLTNQDEVDGDGQLTTSSVTSVSGVGPHRSSSGSGSLLVSGQRHATPAVQRRESTELQVPMAPRVLGNSQKENCSGGHSSKSDAAVFYGMLTPPPKDDCRQIHYYPTGPNHFETLSEELVLHVFTFLTRSTLAKCMRVCKKWHRVGTDEFLWRRIDLHQKKVRARTVNQLIKRGTTHLRLARADVLGKKLRCVNSSFDEEPSMSRLQYLDLSMASISTDMLVDILSHCQQLRKVSLEHVAVNDIVFHLLSENPNLDTLNLSMCQGITSSGLMPLFAHCRKLWQLNLAWTHMKRSCVSYICGAVPKTIRFLNLSGCREAITDDDVELLCSRCTGLMELDLSDSLRVTDSAIDSIRCHLSELQRLSLNRCYSILPSTISTLASLPRLHVLNVMGMLAKEPLRELQDVLKNIHFNKVPFSAVARPTIGQRRTSIWEQRIRENV